MKLELSASSRYLKKYKVTVDEVFKEWLDMEASYRYQDNTIIDYQNRYYKHIKVKLGNVLIYEADYKMFQMFFNDLNDIGLSTNYKIKDVLNVIMNFAIKCQYIERNPLNLVHVTGKDTRNSYQNLVYDEKDFDDLVTTILKKPSYKRKAYIVALYIGRYTGLRISEVFALDKEDFDFKRQYIYVNKKMIYANKKRDELFVKKQLKSSYSYATLPFHKKLQEIMKQWFDYHPFDHVIADDKGQYLNPKQLEYTLWKASKELDISFHFHMLRHTLASRLVSNGAELKAVQEILRHSSITTTMNIYTHVNEEQKRDALYKAFPIKETGTD